VTSSYDFPTQNQVYLHRLTMSSGGSFEPGAQERQAKKARLEAASLQDISTFPPGSDNALGQVEGAALVEDLREAARLREEDRSETDSIQLRKFIVANNKARAFGYALISSELEQIPGSDGMFVLRDIPVLEVDGYKKVSIVVREATEAFWKHCVDRVDATDEECRVVAIGFPGIGKRTSTPLLIRRLLKRGNSVVYHVRAPEKKGWYFRFIPTIGDDKQVTGITSRAIEETNEIPELLSSSTYYIVNPRDTGGCCDPRPGFAPKVIIVSSPDSKYWGGSHIGRGRGPLPASAAKVFFPLWTEDELGWAAPFLFSMMEPDMVNARFRLLSGVQRHMELTYVGVRDQNRV
jgi:hypothetical protein